ncbi:uncharacterized protein LOC127862328 [Dreissena polymorpha]|uniref:uncharacterized protein LOC127862328 n=1 Tax=Dreissena polymorpha TaxID=45954 RepID=UPI002263C145|nr:uncharacterized protein LOC127862328 [Dreissena polymorpha]
MSTNIEIKRYNLTNRVNCCECGDFFYKYRMATCENCPSQCGLWSKCSVTCGIGIQTRESNDRECKSTLSCPNDPCPATNSSTAISTTTATTTTTTHTTASIVKKTDNVTKWPTTTVSTSALPSHDLAKGESLQVVEVAVPVVAAVVIIISIVLGVSFIRRKRHKRLVASNVHSLTHLAPNEVLPHCADNTACKAVYENVLDERENNYTLSLPQRDGSGPGEHPYAELKGRVSSDAYWTIDTELPGTSIVPKTLHSQPNLEDHDYEYIKKI